MQSTNEPVSKMARWSGRIRSALPVLALIMSGVMKLMKPASLVESFNHLGWPETISIGLGVVELVCPVAYMIPRTSVLGAILLTGYLGGATAANVRIGDSFSPPIIMGVMLWGGLYLRDPRLRALIPLKRAG